LIKHNEPEEPPNETLNRVAYAPGELCVRALYKLSFAIASQSIARNKRSKLWQLVGPAMGMYRSK